MTASEQTPTPTDEHEDWRLINAVAENAGGFHIKERDDGRPIQVIRMLYNWRIVLVDSGGKNYEGAWCYFGHGVDSDGTPRTMETARQAAILAAIVWDGYGDPPGHDKKAGT